MTLEMDEPLTLCNRVAEHKLAIDAVGFLAVGAVARSTLHAKSLFSLPAFLLIRTYLLVVRRVCNVFGGTVA